MRFTSQLLRMGLFALLLMPAYCPSAEAENPGCNLDEYGTAIVWIDDAKQASKLAAEQDRLLMVMHLSGDFAKPTFT